MKDKIFLTVMAIFATGVFCSCYKGRLDSMEAKYTKEIEDLKEELLYTQLDFIDYVEQNEHIALNPDDLMQASVRLEILNPLTMELFLCTATAIEKNENIYTFLTVPHCVTELDPITGETILSPSLFWVVSQRPDGSKDTYPVGKIDFLGDLTRSAEGIAVFDVEIDKDIPVFKLAERDPKIGEEFGIVSSHLDVGNRYYTGIVSQNIIVVETGVVPGIFSIGINGLDHFKGTSGGAIVSKEDGMILGLIILSVPHPNGESIAIAENIWQMYKEYKNKKE